LFSPAEEGFHHGQIYRPRGAPRGGPLLIPRDRELGTSIGRLRNPDVPGLPHSARSMTRTASVAPPRWGRFRSGAHRRPISFDFVSECCTAINNRVENFCEWEPTRSGRAADRAREGELRQRGDLAFVSPAGLVAAALDGPEGTRKWRTIYLSSAQNSLRWTGSSGSWLLPR
jgi:hypothetical protein